jgi:predicted transcriptional regulator of viral defense system
MAFLGQGRCVVTASEVEKVAGITEGSARAILDASISVGIVQYARERIPIAGSNLFLITENFPGAPSSDTITKSALLAVARGNGEDTQAAFAYHKALSLHGLSEVATTSIHLIRIRPSILPPSLPHHVDHVPKVRSAKHWTDIPGGSRVFMTLRSDDQIFGTAFVTCRIEGMPIRVTSPMQSLIDAWMHPDWCGGADRVADAWRMIWSQLSVDEMQEQRAELAAFLAKRDGLGSGDH